MAKSDQQNSRLLSLPGELRNHIYRLIAVHEEVRVSAQSQKSGDPVSFWPRFPLLAMACKMTHEEVSTIFYEENRFHFTGYSVRLEQLKSFRTRAGNSSDKLRAIKITRSDNGWAFTFMAMVTNAGITIPDVLDYYDGRSRGRVWGYDGEEAEGVCLCRIRKFARSSRKSLLDFMDDYIEADPQWTAGFRRMAMCKSCRKFISVHDEHLPEHWEEDLILID